MTSQATALMRRFGNQKLKSVTRPFKVTAANILSYISLDVLNEMMNMPDDEFLAVEDQVNLMYADEMTR